MTVEVPTEPRGWANPPESSIVFRMDYAIMDSEYRAEVETVVAW